MWSESVLLEIMQRNGLLNGIIINLCLLASICGLKHLKENGYHKFLAELFVMCCFHSYAIFNKCTCFMEGLIVHNKTFYNQVFCVHLTLPCQVFACIAYEVITDLYKSSNLMHDTPIVFFSMETRNNTQYNLRSYPYILLRK
jgi:hypothetical protein